MGSNGGFAVLDLETTGFSSRGGDRILEVGLVLASPSLEIEHLWTTILNPQRDPGPVGVHGIRKDWLDTAPIFEQVSDELGQLLNGRTLVMHNASFDYSFLRSEFDQANKETNLSNIEPICTLNLARSFLGAVSRYKLSWLAFELNLSAKPDHSALGDSKTTFELLRFLDFNYQALSRIPNASREFHGNFVPPTQSSRAVPRPEITFSSPNRISEVVAALPLRTGMSSGVHEFLDLLDESLIDLEIDMAELEALRNVAMEWGMGADEVESAVHEYFELLVQSAWSDDRLSPAERESLRRKAELLGISESKFESMIYRETPLATLPFGLLPGDSVVLTGDMVPPKEIVGNLLTSNGIQVKSSVSKKTSAVIAADPNSLSGKAQRARELGVPIIDAESVFRAFSAL